MSKNPVFEKILDQLAEGVSFRELKEKFGFSKQEIISAAMYGVAELREEYMTLLAKRRKS